MMRKRFLYLAIVLAALGVLSAAHNFSQPAGQAVERPTVFNAVDVRSLHWSGQHEGEALVIQSGNSPFATFMPPTFNRFSLAKGVDEAARRLGGRVPLLPTLLPKGLNYADVYVGPDVIICYTYEAAADYRLSEVGVEVSKAPSRVPTPEERRRCLQPDQELIQISDIWVTITDNAHSGWNRETIVCASFHYKDPSYIVGGKSPLTKQDIIRIIESMKTPL